MRAERLKETEKENKDLKQVIKRMKSKLLKQKNLIKKLKLDETEKKVC